jgi:succinylarginine dihydrolase
MKETLELPYYEVNIDGLIGPSHNYGGLGTGNLPAQKNKYLISHPRQAALQGLQKMRFIHSLGLKQALFPPHERPSMEAMWKNGLKGNEKKILSSFHGKKIESILPYCSASAMWTANAATVSPTADTGDMFVHITPANLASNKHRCIETSQTERFLHSMFYDKRVFKFHPALPNNKIFFDEGAANHMRLCPRHRATGIEIFIYGKSILDPNGLRSKRFEARQSQEACEETIRRHKLSLDRVVLAQQNPEAIDKGVFHNDVIATANGHVLLCHEKAFVNTENVLKDVKQKYKHLNKKDPHIILIADEDLTVDEAVRSYFFNCQIVTLADGSMEVVFPVECEENKIKDLIYKVILRGPIKKAHFIDLTQSMRNGGGPACLRLRVVLSELELNAAHPGYLLDKEKFEKIEIWIKRHYREKLTLKDLCDYNLLKESRQALDELTQILDIGSVYPFQK